MNKIQVANIIKIPNQQNTDAMIPSPKYGKPHDNMEVNKYSQIRLPAELEVENHGPRWTSPTVTPPCRPPIPTITAGTL
jgi:hypothetical protein